MDDTSRGLAEKQKQSDGCRGQRRQAIRDVGGERLQGVMRSDDIVRRREMGWRERDFARGGVKERSKDEEETGIQRG